MRAYAALLLISGILSTSAEASAPSIFTYQGRMYNEAGTAPLNDSVYFEFTVTSPDGTCVLYQETSSVVDLTVTDGLFAVQVGGGTPSADPNINTFSSLATVFANTATGVAGAHPRPTHATYCPSGYTPAAGEPRLLYVRVTPQSTGAPITLNPPTVIGSVPNAMVADTLQGYAPSDFFMNGIRALGGAGAASTARAGGAQVGGTDLAGGVLVLSGGISTGTGGSSVEIRTATPAGGSGAADNTPTTKLTVQGDGKLELSNVTNGVAAISVNGVNVISPAGNWIGPPVVAVGADGATGVTGSSGASGATGMTGASGATGATGVSGMTGASGMSGATGVTGLSGASGATGATGAGATGMTGVTGNSGASGATGTTGNSGMTGATGETGNSGASGATGTTGNSGMTGATGVTGNSGASGATGATGGGATGETGVTGNSGASGATGASGNTGATGVTGNSGASGATGATGMGETGLTGATGTTGNSGMTGATGGTGATGVTGSSGASGATGATGMGETGATGVTGNSGASGATGASGVTGNSGLSGASGVTGNSGASGATGITGNSGLTGASGVTGNSGASGATGITGNSGLSGASGVTGNSGASGATGRTGPTGMSGASGSTGLSGASGATGITGNSGLTGASGITGNSGASGATGRTGPTGMSGASGVTGPTGAIQLIAITRTLPANGSVVMLGGPVTTTTIFFLEVDIIGASGVVIAKYRIPFNSHIGGSSSWRIARPYEQPYATTSTARYVDLEYRMPGGTDGELRVRTKDVAVVGTSISVIIREFGSGAFTSSYTDTTTSAPAVPTIAMGMVQETYEGVGIGAFSPYPQAKLHVTADDTTGASILETLRLSRVDSDSAGSDGIGAAINFSLETETDGTYRDAAKIEAVLDEANDSAKLGSLRFSTVSSASHAVMERMRIDGVGNVSIGPQAAATANVKLDVAGQIISRQQNRIGTDAAPATSGTCDFANGNLCSITAGASMTVTLSNMVVGGAYTVVVHTTGAGVSAPSFAGYTIRWAGGTAPAAVGAANHSIVFSFLATQDGAASPAIRVIGSWTDSQ